MSEIIKNEKIIKALEEKAKAYNPVNKERYIEILSQVKELKTVENAIIILFLLLVGNLSIIAFVLVVEVIGSVFRLEVLKDLTITSYSFLAWVISITVVAVWGLITLYKIVLARMDGIWQKNGLVRCSTKFSEDALYSEIKASCYKKVDEVANKNEVVKNKIRDILKERDQLILLDVLQLKISEFEKALNCQSSTMKEYEDMATVREKFKG